MLPLGLHLGDCLDPFRGLPALPDQSIDVVISDPPYGATVEKQARSLKERGTAELTTGKAKRYEFGYGALAPELRAGVAQEIARLCRRWALVFTDVEGLADWIDAMGACGMRYVRCGAWIRTNGAPQITGDRPAVGFEAIGIFHAPGGRMKWNGRGSRAVWTYPIVHSGARERLGGHTTPKPLELMRELVRLFSDPGELVADPFAGSATTGVAAKGLGRRFIGWELDEGFYKRARRRLEGTKHQLDWLSPVPRRRRARQLAIELGP